VLVAPGFEPETLEVVKRKREGRYLVLEVDPEYAPPPTEMQDVFGMTLEQDRNTFVPSDADLATIVTANRELPEEARRDALVGLLVLKYTQSNSIALTYGGQTIGVGAGQQSRLHCARIACDKADRWFLRQHPQLLDLSFRPDVRRTDRNNAVEVLLTEEPGGPSWRRLDAVLESVPPPLSEEERMEWLGRFAGATLSSDALIPFRDTLDRAVRSGVRYVVQAGGALRNEQTVEAANEYGMVMVYTGTRLFHH
jgi:phosphoribosylaminoimidazolecarboxamide formyltransferase/IMP cyclohydrolase